MKASALIKRLQEEVDKHGDLPVRYEGSDSRGGGDTDVDFVFAYNPFGNSPGDVPDELSEAVEIYLH